MKAFQELLGARPYGLEELPVFLLFGASRATLHVAPLLAATALLAAFAVLARELLGPEQDLGVGSVGQCAVGGAEPADDGLDLAVTDLPGEQVRLAHERRHPGRRRSPPDRDK